MRICLCWPLVLLLAGCQSRPLGPYVAPRVVGQVVADDTHAPLPGVRVTRGKLQHPPLAGWTPKGAEMLMEKPPVLTDAAGRFELASERVLSLVRGAGWNQVRLSFQRAGYEAFQTNCAGALATNSAAGEPILDVGTIRLLPLPQATETAPEKAVPAQ